MRGRRTASKWIGGNGFGLVRSVGVAPGTFQYSLLIRKGQLLHGVGSSFAAEALAIEWALDTFSETTAAFTDTGDAARDTDIE
eukprot:5782469-Karenia_brevis.AAC.1